MQPSPPLTREPVWQPAPWVLPAMVACTLAIGTLGGMRWPGMWAATHYMFDYSQGFAKRGLIGELLSAVTGQHVVYQTIAYVSILVFLAWLSLLLFVIRSAARSNASVWWISAAFFLSPGFAFMVHEMGYADHFGMLTALLCLLLPANLAGLILR